MLRPFAEYLLEFASTSWGPVVLVVHAFLEAFILPVAHEIFLIAVSLARPEMSFVYALMSTTASTAGILVGYSIGKWGGHRILTLIFKPALIKKAEEHIHKYDFWAIAIACFTPIPVKIFALVAGTVELSFKKMLVVSFFARGARYFLVSTLLYFYGEQAREWILDYLDWIMVALLVIMVVGFAVLHLIPHDKPDKKDPADTGPASS